MKVSSGIKSLETLLDLDETKYVIDEELGLWVKFEARQVIATNARPHGVKYNFTLHDVRNHRILGFDNAHAVGKERIKSNQSFDHYTRHEVVFAIEGPISHDL